VPVFPVTPFFISAKRMISQKGTTALKYLLMAGLYWSCNNPDLERAEMRVEAIMVSQET